MLEGSLEIYVSLTSLHKEVEPPMQPPGTYIVLFLQLWGHSDLVLSETSVSCERQGRAVLLGGMIVPPDGVL